MLTSIVVEEKNTTTEHIMSIVLDCWRVGIDVFPPFQSVQKQYTLSILCERVPECLEPI